MLLLIIGVLVQTNSSSHFSTLLHVLHVHNTAICAKDWVQIMWTFSSLHLKCYCLIALGPKMNFSFCAEVSDFFPNLCGTKIINQHLHLFPFLIQLWFCICWCGEEEESRVLWIATSTSKSSVLNPFSCSFWLFEQICPFIILQAVGEDLVCRWKLGVSLWLIMSFGMEKFVTQW